MTLGPVGTFTVPRGAARGTALLVLACALLAAAARLPGIGWSARPDESGFTLVARAWDPSPESPFGHYWVDRPPLLVALVKVTDGVGGPLGIRWVAVVGCALLVLAAAAAAREVALTGAAAQGTGRAVGLTVVATTALVSNASIDLVGAKGEVLSLPLLVGSLWLSLRGLRTGSATSTLLAGLLAGVALGLKQNHAAGLVFAIVLLLGEWSLRRLGTRDLVRLGGAFLAGVAAPMVATLGWAMAEGVRLSALWYAVVGFRGEALHTILAGPVGAPLRRAVDLVGVVITSGLMLLLLWFILSVRRLERERPALTLAALAVLLVDSVALVLGGSYWRPYLFGLVPAAVLAVALLASEAPATARRPARSRVVTGAVVAALVAGSVLAGVQWARTLPASSRASIPVLIGRAIGAASRPGDTLTVWGGRADLQLASGLRSPYRHLWSLPARTRDPGSAQLAAVLAGPDAPTWFVAWTGLGGWEDRTPAVVGPVLAERYLHVASACGGRALYRLRDAPRPTPAVGCADLRAARATATPDAGGSGSSRQPPAVSRADR